MRYGVFSFWIRYNPSLPLLRYSFLPEPNTPPLSFARYVLLLGCLLIGNVLHAQAGCTDPQATNYDAGATTNDGSCVYPSTIQQAGFLVNLPDALDECSGLVFFGDQLWAHNDGGNAAVLHRVDTLSGEILREVAVANATNVDWEDIAQSETHLFIADMGNNLGSRTDLRIYRVAKADLPLSNSVNAELITFNYADQTDFTAAPQANNYDAEALLFAGDSLHLFTKNWLDKQTRHYVLPAVPGNYSIAPRDTFNVNGLLTAAANYRDTTAMLLGYDLDNGAVFGWLLFDFPAGQPLKGNKRRLELGLVLTLSQAEALTWRTATGGYIGSESASVLAARLSTFSAQPFLENPTALDALVAPELLRVRPNPTTETIYVTRPGAAPRAELRVYRPTGRLHVRRTLDAPETAIATGSWPPGLYYFVVEGRYGTWVVKS